VRRVQHYRTLHSAAAETCAAVAVTFQGCIQSEARGWGGGGTLPVRAPAADNALATLSTPRAVECLYPPRTRSILFRSVPHVPSSELRLRLVWAVRSESLPIWHLIRVDRQKVSNLSSLPTGWTEESGFDPWQGQEIFLFSIASRPALRPTKPPTYWVPGVKWPGREADQAPPSVPRLRMVKNTSSWRGITLPFTF
jgi:hypothetical protein